MIKATLLTLAERAALFTILYSFLSGGGVTPSERLPPRLGTDCVIVGRLNEKRPNSWSPRGWETLPIVMDRRVDNTGGCFLNAATWPLIF